MKSIEQRINRLAQEGRDDVAGLLKQLIAIPSMSGQEGGVIEQIRVMMKMMGMRTVRIDRLGNIIGTIGTGSKVLAIDAHVDTVEVGDLDAWESNPFEAVEKNGWIYGRGASDQKGGMASMLLATRILKEVGVPKGITVMFVGSIMEEDSDGLCWQYLINEEEYRPNWVVITEPTGLAVNHGQRGRVEIEVTTSGKSAHAAAPEQGTNAIYLMNPIINAIRKHGSKLKKEDKFLGKGSIAITDIRSRAPSLCAVPDRCTAHLDRRLTAGETDISALEEIKSLPEVKAANASVTIPDYSAPSYRGVLYTVQKYYPSWILKPDHTLVKAGISAAQKVLRSEPELKTWNFSTNGVATMGLFGIPTIGFGPSEEQYAHSPEDRCPIDHLVSAAAFYAYLPYVLQPIAEELSKQEKSEEESEEDAQKEATQ